ncbi:hypothetical protein GGTG_07089 [Gaeumannomyces tritici R3-111a-1]|uniref:Uncharacterized protein n=1 Tax=Gaeumannomyces tritici (strain R3-111a-1) TaxID=644352 RepID=J3P0P4_GAET3|nr:hypothetical protein GGTG_07089 [Gaeumannomyces tritici R3-111a-1]EJT77177.1 hypothetical protein GGTG_07089 [Gaeumannomyces tritici R3-111a-1]
MGLSTTRRDRHESDAGCRGCVLYGVVGEKHPTIARHDVGAVTVVGGGGNMTAPLRRVLGVILKTHKKSWWAQWPDCPKAWSLGWLEGPRSTSRGGDFTGAPPATAFPRKHVAAFFFFFSKPTASAPQPGSDGQDVASREMKR